MNRIVPKMILAAILVVTVGQAVKVNGINQSCESNLERLQDAIEKNVYAHNSGNG